MSNELKNLSSDELDPAREFYIEYDEGSDPGSVLNLSHGFMIMQRSTKRWKAATDDKELAVGILRVVRERNREACDAAAEAARA